MRKILFWSAIGGFSGMLFTNLLSAFYWGFGTGGQLEDYSIVGYVLDVLRWLPILLTRKLNILPYKPFHSIILFVQFFTLTFIVLFKIKSYKAQNKH